MTSPSSKAQTLLRAAGSEPESCQTSFVLTFSSPVENWSSLACLPCTVLTTVAKEKINRISPAALEMGSVSSSSPEGTANSGRTLCTIPLHSSKLANSSKLAGRTLCCTIPLHSRERRKRTRGASGPRCASLVRKPHIFVLPPKIKANALEDVNPDLGEFELRSHSSGVNGAQRKALFPPS